MPWHGIDFVGFNNSEAGEAAQWVGWAARWLRACCGIQVSAAHNTDQSKRINRSFTLSFVASRGGPWGPSPRGTSGIVGPPGPLFLSPSLGERQRETKIRAPRGPTIPEVPTRRGFPGPPRDATSDVEKPIL
ncbi:hypothetical protein ACOSQ3_001567 [Xanthoceras sorbifolium]